MRPTKKFTLVEPVPKEVLLKTPIAKQQQHRPSKECVKPPPAQAQPQPPAAAAAAAGGQVASMASTGGAAAAAAAQSSEPVTATGAGLVVMEAGDALGRWLARQAGQTDRPVGGGKEGQTGRLVGGARTHPAWARLGAGGAPEEQVDTWDSVAAEPVW